MFALLWPQLQGGANAYVTCPLLLEACKSHAPSLNHYFHFANLLADDGTIFVYVPLFWK